MVECGFCYGEIADGEDYRVTAGGELICAKSCEPAKCRQCGGQVSVHQELCAPCRIEAHERTLLPADQWGWDGTPWEADDPTARPGLGGW